MSDKFWNVVIEGTHNSSPNAPGMLRPELVGTLTHPGKLYPSAGFTLFYDDMPPDVWDAFVKSVWEDPLKKIVNLGLVQSGPMKFVGTNIPDGITRKIYRHLVSGQINAIEFGDSEGRKRGRSHSDDFHDDGKHKHGK